MLGLYYYYSFGVIEGFFQIYLWDGILPISLSVLPSEIVGDFDFIASIIAAAIPEALEAGLDSSLEGGFDGSLGEGVLDLRTSDLTIVGSSSSINTPKLISRKNRVAEFFFLNAKNIVSCPSSLWWFTNKMPFYDFDTSKCILD